MKTVIALFLLGLVGGCSTNAEMTRPEDTTVLRASYTKASLIYSAFVGSTDICQVTALDRPDTENGPLSAASLLGDYGVVLDKDGCSIIPRSMLGADE